MQTTSCGFKTAWLIQNSNKIKDAIIDNSIFELFKNRILPKSWNFKGTDISGAAGFVLLFGIDPIITQSECQLIEEVLFDINTYE